MMELTTCAFIVILVSVVTATPYGYGVKGGSGAFSTAESNAAAGSFGNRGDIPPFDGAFSGSFSKSSSSSSASSSASSSSSSSSFSYNGFGGGSPSNPGTNGNTGCTSAICQGAGQKGPTDVSAGTHGYNAANSIALAGSGAASGVSGVDCQGSQCDSQPGKCLSGQCQPKLPIEPSITGYDSGNRCSSGQCGSPSQSGSSTSQYDDSEDIHFVAHSSKSGHDSKDHSSNDKTRGYSDNSDCRNGNCGPSTINTQPAVTYGTLKPYPAYSNPGVTPAHTLPATHLQTPNQNSGCISGVCGTGHDSSPTSYNIPIHGSPAGCNTPGCSTEFSSPGVNPQFHYDNNKPDTSEKKLPPYTGGFGGPAGLLKPNEHNIPMPTTGKPANPFNTPSTSVTGCTTYNCIGSPTGAGGAPSTAQAGSYNNHQDSGSLTGSTNKPIYTGGFGGPPGMLKPDEYDIKVPIHSTKPSYNNHSPTSPVGCTTPNCNGFPPKPSTGAEPSSKLPPYNGGFGGPPGILRPNEFNMPFSTPNIPSSSPGDRVPQPSFGLPKPITVPHPSYAGSTSSYRPIGVTYPGSLAVAPITPSYTIAQPLHPSGTSSTECKTGNCAAYPGSGNVVSAPSGSSEGCKTGNCAGYPGSDVSIPSGPYGHTEICKTGNCGDRPNSGSDVNSGSEANASSGLYGYSGCKTGNCAIPTNAAPSGPRGDTYPNTSGKPSNTQYTTGFSTPSNSVLPSNSVSLAANSGVDTQSGSYSGSKEKLPVYTGGFGGPSGLLKPNDYSKPDVTATPYKPLPGLSTPVTCSSGNCNPNGALPLSTGSNTELNGAHATAVSSASANAVAYSGGFGGPPGVLNPYDDGKVDLTKITAAHNQISHYGGANTGGSGHRGIQSNINSQHGNAASATAVAGSSSSANSGSIGYNSNGNGIKGGSPCGGGCGGGYQNGLQGSGSSAVAGARSLSSSGAYGVGGSFASSSASAHSSAGAYTKGGYGKR